MTAKFSLRATGAALLLVMLVALFGCNGGGSDNQPDLNGKRPSITDLSTHSANIGDTLDVYGLNFGLSQSSGSVALNGVDFVVNTWSDTQINITVAAGMVSGIVVVTSGGLPSQSGPEAQLFIPAAPAGRPLINAVTPEFGTAGDEILITGSGFGDAGSGNVFFPSQAGAVSQTDGVVAAEIVTVDVDGTPVPQWGGSSIKFIVPSQAQFGKVYIYVEINGQRSNEMPFIVNPPPGGQPAIYDVTPPNGPIGTTVTITGENFGPAQSGATLMLGDFHMSVATWTDGEITAQVPDGAVTADIVLTKPGFVPVIWQHFIVENSPVITGVSPSIVDVGDAFTVYGHSFGKEQGGGRLRIGGTGQTVSSWSDTKLVVDSLGALPGSGELMTVVTNDAGLMSNEVPVYYLPSFDVRINVSPKAGQRDGSGGEAGTVFTFTASASGGSGNYNYYLIPNADDESVEAPVSNDGVINYTYPYDAGAPDEQYVDTKMRVVDTSNNASLTVDGPTILVVTYGTPVVTDVVLSDFNRLGTNAPNDACYLATDQSYHDFSFVAGMPQFTSSVGQVMSGGNPVQGYTRNLESFMQGGVNERPYGYRYFGANGSVVTVVGLNFGTDQGQLFLNAAAANPADVVEVTDFEDWTDTAVSFKLPAVSKRLSGVVQLIPSGDTYQANSIEPLICSAYVVQQLPEEVEFPVGQLTLSGFDFAPTTLTDVTGTQTYSIWTVAVNYTDPWDGGTKPGLWLMTTPVMPASLSGTTMTFNMGDIDVDHNGTVPVEVFNSDNSESQVVEGTPIDGDWYFFLWTGVLTDGSNQVRANSGIFSELYKVTVGSGPGPGGDPVAILQANPTNGEAPLLVNFDASASHDDGTIVKYEFDFGDGGGWEDFGTTTTAQYTYNSDGTYIAKLRVTDDEDNVSPVVQQTITVGGPPPGNQFQVGVTINVHDPDPPLPPLVYDIITRVRLHSSAPGDPGAPFFDQIFTDLPEPGVEQVVTFNDVPDGQVWVSVSRIVTEWDSGDTSFGVYGPFTIPDTAIVHIIGDQYEQPPPPG